MEGTAPKQDQHPAETLVIAFALPALLVHDNGGVASAPVLEQMIRGSKVCRSAGPASLHPSEELFETSMAGHSSRLL